MLLQCNPAFRILAISSSAYHTHLTLFLFSKYTSNNISARALFTFPTRAALVPVCHIILDTSQSLLSYPMVFFATSSSFSFVSFPSTQQSPPGRLPAPATQFSLSFQHVGLANRNYVVGYQPSVLFSITLCLFVRSSTMYWQHARTPLLRLGRNHFAKGYINLLLSFCL